MTSKKILSILLGGIMLLTTSQQALANTNNNGSVIPVQDNLYQNENLKEELRNILRNKKDSSQFSLYEAQELYNKIILEELKQETFNSRNTIQRGVIIKNYKSESVSNYIPRYGEYNGNITQGYSETKDIAVTIPVGVNFETSHGSIQLGVEVQLSKSRTVAGPSYNTKLPGTNLNATHSNIIGVIEGSILWESYDLYDQESGRTTHIEHYIMPDKYLVTYTLLVSDSYSDYYVAHCTRDVSKNFKSMSNYINILESTNVKNAYSW